MVYKYLNYLRHRVKAVIKCSSQLLKLLNSLFVWRIYQQKMSAELNLYNLSFCDFRVHKYINYKHNAELRGTAPGKHAQFLKSLTSSRNAVIETLCAKH